MCKQSHSLRIGPISLSNRSILAPMSGVTDWPFRRIAARYGAAMVVGEMTASKMISRGDIEAQIRFECAGLFPKVVQLAGCEQTSLALAAQIAEECGADIIDINMGCPAKRVTNGYAGSALMRDLDHALRLIEAVVQAVRVPVTVKMRLGWDERTMNATELAVRAEAVGVQAITIHGRTRSQFYRGQANWHAIGEVVRAVSIPVIANGDVRTIADAQSICGVSMAAAVMVGRGAYGRPWLPGQIGQALAGKAVTPAPSGSVLYQLIFEHYEAMLSHYQVDNAVRIARKHLGWYLDLLQPVASLPALRRTILTAHEPDKVIIALGDIFNETGGQLAA